MNKCPKGTRWNAEESKCETKDDTITRIYCRMYRRCPLWDELPTEAAKRLKEGLQMGLVDRLDSDDIEFINTLPRGN
jgi:hypothetical protein